MKKQYQISGHRAAGAIPAVGIVQSHADPLTFPIAGSPNWRKPSLGDLLRGVGKAFIETVMEAEVEQLAGKRSARIRTARPYRWGTEKDSACRWTARAGADAATAQPDADTRSRWAVTRFFRKPH